MEEYIDENQRDKKEREEFNNNPNAVVAITPKGLFYLVLHKYFGIEDVMDDRVHAAWNEYEQWVRTMYGRGEFVGGIVFDKKGGEFIPLIAGTGNDLPPDIDENDTDENDD